MINLKSYIQSNIVSKAYFLAEYIHDGQHRKFGNKEPYFNHVISVASIVFNLNLNNSDDIICAAYLHDVIEMCPNISSKETKDIIKENFNENVCDLVFNYLTKNPTVDYFDYIAKIKTDEFAKIIKIADIQHNISTLPYFEDTKWTIRQLEKYTKALIILNY